MTTNPLRDVVPGPAAVLRHRRSGGVDRDLWPRSGAAIPVRTLATGLAALYVVWAARGLGG